MDLRTGLAVRLSNARTGEPLCVGTVVAIDGDFRETLNNSNCAFFGAHERPGSYRLEALAEGFVPAVREGVVVDADECHVIRTDLTIPLEPDPNAPADGGIESGP